MGLQYEQPGLKGHPWPLELIDSVTLGLTYQVRIMTLASTVFKRSLFQKKSHLNALGIFKANLTLT